MPLATAGKPFGVIGVKFREPGPRRRSRHRRLLLAVEDQVAVAIERNRLSDELAGARVAAESDKLRAALLNSVSHDLRTPLVTVIGAASALAESGEELDPAQRQELASAVLDEAGRLDRYVQNLLDMTGSATALSSPSARVSTCGRSWEACAATWRARSRATP